MNLRHFVFQPTLLLLCLVRSHLLYSSDQRPLLDYRCALSCLFLPVYTKRQIALNWARVQLPCSPQGISYALTVTWSGIYMALALPHHETGQRRWVVPIRHRFLPGMADNAMTDGEPNWDSMPPPIDDGGYAADQPPSDHAASPFIVLSRFPICCPPTDRPSDRLTPLVSSGVPLYSQLIERAIIYESIFMVSELENLSRRGLSHFEWTTVRDFLSPKCSSGSFFLQ